MMSELSFAFMICIQILSEYVLLILLNTRQSGLIKRSCVQAAHSAGHRTLLYGHAILLRHSFSGMVSKRTSHTWKHTNYFTTVLCYSIWPVWRRPDPWRINYHLMWDCKRTRQVETVWSCAHRPCFLFSSYVCLCVPGEACWWTIHPASKQRSEGEKVRIGDDLILVSVSSERYLVSVNHSFSLVTVHTCPTMPLPCTSACNIADLEDVLP